MKYIYQKCLLWLNITQDFDLYFQYPVAKIHYLDKKKKKKKNR